MKKILTALGILALTGGGALAADKILKGDQFVVTGVNFRQPFKTPSGQILKAGVYDLKVVSDGTEGVLIGLLKEGKQVGQLRGIAHFVNFGDLRPTPRDGKAGSGSPGQAVPGDQNVKLQPAGISVPLDNKAFRDLGFTPASPVSFGGGSGKISCSLNFHPGSPNRPYIEFDFLPDTQKK
jgi:hypothetical protein